MAVQPDRPNSSSLLTIAITGSILTLVVAVLAAAAYEVVVADQAQEKQLGRDVSEYTEMLYNQRQDLAGLEAAKARVLEAQG